MILVVKMWGVQNICVYYHLHKRPDLKIILNVDENMYLISASPLFIKAILE